MTTTLSLSEGSVLRHRVRAGVDALPKCARNMLSGSRESNSTLLTVKYVLSQFRGNCKKSYNRGRGGGGDHHRVGIHGQWFSTGGCCRLLHVVSGRLRNW